MGLRDGNGSVYAANRAVARALKRSAKPCSARQRAAQRQRHETHRLMTTATVAPCLRALAFGAPATPCAGKDYY